MEERINRRNFIRKAIAAIIGIQIFALIFSFFRNQNKHKELEEQWTELGKVNEFEAGRTYSFPNSKVFLHLSTEGKFLAISNKCTHLGCAVNLDSTTQNFICPCHSSMFDKLGNVIQSPAKRALDYYPIKITANKVMVNLNNSKKRTAFNNSQTTTA